MSLALLEQREVTKATAQTAPETLVLNAIRQAGIPIMQAETKRELKRQIVEYFREKNISGLFKWRSGRYNLKERTYRALDASGTKEIDQLTHPTHAFMTERLDEELRKIVGIKVEYEVETYWTDPIGRVIITFPDCSQKAYEYSCWLGNQWRWPLPE